MNKRIDHEQNTEKEKYPIKNSFQKEEQGTEEKTRNQRMTSNRRKD